MDDRTIGRSAKNQFEHSQDSLPMRVEITTFLRKILGIEDSEDFLFIGTCTVNAPKSQETLYAINEDRFHL